MPRVETYGERRVRSGALPGVRKQFADTPQSLGAGVGEAMAGVGAAAARLGVTTFNVIQEQEQKRADEVAQLTFHRQLSELERQLLTDPDKGALHAKGKDAVGLSGPTLEKFDEQAGMIEGTLTNDRQRRAFHQARDERRFRMGVRLDAHVEQQLTEYEQKEFEAFQATTVQDAADNASDPPRVAAEFERQDAAIATHGTRLGLGPAAQAHLRDELRNKTWEAVISRVIESGKDQAARVYLEAARDAKQLTGPTLTHMMDVVTRATTDAAGERAATELWLAHGPKADTDPISIDVMEDAARARFSGDSDVLKATIAALRTRKQGVDDGRRERANLRDTAIWGAVLEGRSYDEIRRLPAAVSAPAELLKVRKYFEDRAEHEERLAATREGRAFQREQRAFAAEVRKEKQLEIESWSTYRELTQPEVLRELTHGEIVSKLPTLGRENVTRLLNEKEQLTRSDEAVKEATIDKALFNDVAEKAGLTYVYALAPGDTKTGKAQRANLGKLEAAVKAEIARVQQKAGARGGPRVLTNDEKRKVMEAIVDQKVMVKDPGWFYDSEEPMIASIVNEKDRANAYVPIDRVPKQALEDYANYLRGEHPHLARLSTDEVRARYAAPLEHAYALRLLGATREEIIAALKSAAVPPRARAVPPGLKGDQ